MGSGGSGPREVKTRLAIVRPFCEFDAEALPTTFTCWNALSPCKAASADIGDADYDDDEEYGSDLNDNYEVGPSGRLVSYNKNSTAGRNLYDDFNGERHFFDLVGSDAMKNAKADVFLFYSQTFAENDVAIKAVDAIIDQFFEPGGWSQCFDNIYAIEANIPQELDLYIPSAQEELYNWVNGPNRQFEAAFRIIQSGEWGEYDGFYLMEGDSVPIKAHWLDVVLSEIEVNRPFAILGAQYDGDKWDNFYEKIPISLLHHTNGNAIYNTSHPLLERLVGQLEVEAPCPYNSIPYDYRMSQMWVEGTLGIVPELAPKIMLNEEGENITLSSNLEMFKKWADIWENEDPFKYTPVIHNYAATNLIPRHLGPEYIIHGAKLYSPWDPTKSEVTLVVSEWFFDRSLHLINNLDEKDHPFSEVVVMVPPVAGSHDDYDQMSDVPVRTQHRGAPDFMDLCEADVRTDWFMLTNSYHHVARHVDLMFTPGTFKPVIPFTPATYPFCFKFPYCKETINLAQRINPGHDKVVLDMDMLYNTEARDAFCKEWREENGEEGEDLYKHQQRRLMFRKKIIGPPGPTGTSYFAYLMREKKDGMYKMTDRSLYGARPPFVKIFAKEEKLDGMSEDELAKRVGMTLMDNSTDCNCGAYETEAECSGSGIGCIWRPLFESCHPPELIDGGEPICATSEAPTMAPTVSLAFQDTESPTVDTAAADAAEEGSVVENDQWYTSMFKSREHEEDPSVETNSTEDPTIMADDDDSILDPESPARVRNLEIDALDPWYETDLSAEQRMGFSDEPRRKLEINSPMDTQDPLYETDRKPELLSTSGHDSPARVMGLEADAMGTRYRDDRSSEQLVDSSEEPSKKLEVKSSMDTQNPLHETDLKSEQRIDFSDESLDARYNNDGKAQRETILPMKTCDPWDPSIVPRNPTASNTWAGASLDPESRSFSAMAISRPRKLHGSFLQYQLFMSQLSLPTNLEQLALSSIYATSSPLKESWLTSSVPINVPKYATHQKEFRSNHRVLDVPEIDRKTFVNYGEGEDYQPLRITFATDHLLNYKKHRKSPNNRKRSEPVTLATISRIEALTGEVLPAVAEIWAGALSVLRSVDNMFPLSLGGSNDDTCGEATIPPRHRTQGVPLTDTLIYVTIDGPQCYNHEKARGIVSYSTVCSFDQNLRPIFANIDVCLSNVEVTSGEVSEQENLRLTSTLTVEVGKLLGLSPSLFHHFRSAETGQPFGSTEKKVTCVNGTELTLLVPNVLQSRFDHGADALGYGGWEVTTPTVQQVIRNHFDCQSLLGAKLSQDAGSSSCFGDSFDPRYHFDEDFTSIGGSADMAFSLSPLTLALLEDSGWYRANFEKSTAPLFGRGAGCGFVEGNCIAESKKTVPDYSQGFFCSDTTPEIHGSVIPRKHMEPSGCDYTYNHKADCSSLGEGESDAFCPMRIANTKSCSDKANSPSLDGEIYSSNSRCFVTDTPASICLESYCNSIDSKIDIVVDEKVFQCDYEGQKLDLGHGYIVQCPRLAIVCPHLVCPTNCSGRGVCDYCQELPRCVCDDPFEESLDCSGDSTSAGILKKDGTKVTVESMTKKLAQLAKIAEENERELREEDEVISTLQKKQLTMKKLTLRIDESEKNEREIREDDLFLSNTYNQPSSQLIDVSKSNEIVLGEDDAVVSNLHKKQSIMKSLSQLIDTGDENKTKLRAKDDVAISSMQQKQSTIKKLSQLIVQSVENERVLREGNTAVSNWNE
mmetsp:Transcript_30290/g.65409  ORF Transcript_30290/g.65409 Transcript_30290/m.65409 type:complete len:1736 (-) Transcript_30290:678-5885(-)